MKQQEEEFITTLLAIQSPEEMRAFLHGILTPKEYAELPTRLNIFKMLHARIPQHEIAKDLGVGVATVTRGSQEIKRGFIQKTSWWNNLSNQMGG